MELRHLDTLMAIDEQGSFTAAADRLNTVQSNVSDQVRQLERELGVELLVRSRRGATPTESGRAVLLRARRIRRELDGLREDLAALRGLQVGNAAFGIVGTASRWLVPELVAELRERAPGVRLRISEGASERLAADVLADALPQAVVTEPVRDDRLMVEHLLEEQLVGLAAEGVDLPRAPVPLAALAARPMVMPPANNPLRQEVEDAAGAARVRLDVPVEVEGIRLITDLVAAGVGISVLPETAIPPALPGVRTFTIDALPPRRLALVTAKDSHLSLADRAVREAVLRIVAARRRAIG